MNRDWCNRILEGLLASGVEDLVVTPGSRSTPLLLAAIESPLRLHSVIDERSAAFFALGRARALGTKVAMLCTSGSAGAHYLPALLEARYAGHCLIAITADRPLELHDCGANQTIAQESLFAAACPAPINLGVPDGSALAARRRVQQAVSLAAGPIHINLPFRKPLEPRESDTSVLASDPPPPRIWPAASAISSAALARIGDRCRAAKRGVIVAGPCHPDLGPLLVALAEATGFVLLAESTSGARFSGRAEPQRCDAFAHILSVPQLVEELRPDLVVHVGLEPSCGALLRWLGDLGALTLRLAGDRPRNTVDGACELVLGPVADAIERLLPTLSPCSDTSYLTRWRAADERAWQAIDRLLSTPADAIGEAQAASAIFRSLAPGTQLTIGNSLAIRSADAVVPGHRSSLRILHQRGTSGIEGLIAGAIGASQEGPSALLLGDVSAAHDLSSLALASLCRGPLRMMMIDNGGGQIFASLPLAQQRLSEQALAFWLTPPAVDFEAACKAYAVPYKKVSESQGLEAALRWSDLESGCSLLHLVVEPSSMLSYLAAAREALA